MYQEGEHKVSYDIAIQMGCTAFDMDIRIT